MSTASRGIAGESTVPIGRFTPGSVGPLPLGACTAGDGSRLTQDHALGTLSLSRTGYNRNTAQTGTQGRGGIPAIGMNDRSGSGRGKGNNDISGNKGTLLICEGPIRVHPHHHHATQSVGLQSAVIPDIALGHDLYHPLGPNRL